MTDEVIHMRNRNSQDTCSCPTQYNTLREKILYCWEAGLTKQALRLRKHLRAVYPELFAQVYHPAPLLNGRNAGRGTVDYERLFQILDLPYTKTCTCGAETEFAMHKLGPREFCSVKCAASSTATRDKYRETCLAKYGHDNAWKAEAVKRKISRTTHARYGVRNIQQRPDVHRRTLMTGFRWKQYVSRRGRVYSCQGHEHIVLSTLDRYKNIRSFSVEAPTIDYHWNGKDRKYFPDILAVTTDGRKLLIEVKSRYTLQNDLDRNLAKFRAARRYCAEHGLEFWIAIPQEKEILWGRSLRDLRL